MEDDFNASNMHQNGEMNNDSQNDADPDVLLFSDEAANNENATYKTDEDQKQAQEDQFAGANVLNKQKKDKKRKHKDKTENPLKKTAVITIVLCMVLSVATGFGGGYLGYSIARNKSGNGTEVLYQSVTRTSTDSENGGDNLSVSDIASMNADCVVAITTETASMGSRMQQYVTKGAGSGIIITTTGYIATNYHVIDGANKITVTLNNGTDYTAALIGTDQQTDIAVIKIDADNLKPVVIGDSGALQVGELAVAIGNPLGELGGTVTSGIISALDRSITIDGQTMTLLQTNAAINPGNSGGGLFNGQGELIGIVNAKSSGTGIEGLGFAIPVNTVKPVFEQLISNGTVKTNKVEMGVTLTDTDNGVCVVKVEKNSNAEKAGILKGDYILSVNGSRISSAADVKSTISNISVGDSVKVVVLRNNRERTLTMDIAETQS